MQKRKADCPQFTDSLLLYPQNRRGPHLRSLDQIRLQLWD